MHIFHISISFILGFLSYFFYEYYLSNQFNNEILKEASHQYDLKNPNIMFNIEASDYSEDEKNDEMNTFYDFNEKKEERKLEFSKDQFISI